MQSPCCCVIWLYLYPYLMGTVGRRSPVIPQILDNDAGSHPTHIRPTRKFNVQTVKCALLMRLTAEEKTESKKPLKEARS